MNIFDRFFRWLWKGSRMFKPDFSIIEGWIKREKRGFRDRMEDAQEERYSSYVDYCWAAREVMTVVVAEWLLARLQAWEISQEDVNADVVYRIEQELREALGVGLPSNITEQIEALLDDIDSDEK